MSVTDTPSTVPVPSTPPASGRAPRDATEPVQATTPAPVAVVPAVAPAAPSPPAIGFSLSYDAATQRLVLEALEPGSGFVISQVPPGYVVKQFSATVSGIAPARGATVDSAA